jgi:sister-chromatid-cohesion protein PDS5
LLIGFFFYRYIDFYLDMLGTPETVSLLHHLASKAKTVRDADNQTESEARTL